jgi:hypothetical protein
MLRLALAISFLVFGWQPLSLKAAAPPFEWIVLSEAAPSAAGVNFIFAAEGYTATQRERFVADCQALVAALVNQEPWKTYAGGLNFYASWIVSREEGISRPKTNTVVDTAFKATIDTDTRLAFPQLDLAFEYMRAVPTLGHHVFVLNTTLYGGAGGTFASVTRNASSTEILLHELGHSFAQLEDEYETSSGEFNYSRKNTASSVANITWTPWIETGTPLPTPASLATTGANERRWTLIGGFQGSMTPNGLRPTYTSKMRELHVPYGPVNSEALILGIYSKAAPITTTQPAAGDVQLGSEQQEFSLRLWPVPTLGVTWFFNDREVSQESRYIVRPADLRAGSNVLKAVVRDRTSAVRNDPLNLREETVEWRFTSSQAPAITTQPLSQSVTAGQAVSFAIVASGTAPLTYQWRKASASLAGATSATLSIASASAADAGTYTCVVTNPWGSVESAAATLSVAPSASPPSGGGGGGGGGAMDHWFAVGLLLAGLARRAAGRRALTGRNTGYPS